MKFQICRALPGIPLMELSALPGPVAGGEGDSLPPPKELGAGCRSFVSSLNLHLYRPFANDVDSLLSFIGPSTNDVSGLIFVVRMIIADI